MVGKINNNAIIAKHYLADMTCFNCSYFEDIILLPSGKTLKFKNPHCKYNNIRNDIPKKLTCEFWSIK